jgi:hypothetical protein
MNARQWREHGYKTVFRFGTVYLFRPGSGVVIQAPVRGGDWMEQDNVHLPPWVVVPAGIDGLGPELREHILAAVAYCYCDQGVGTCDFCSYTRRPPDPLALTLP